MAKTPFMNVNIESKKLQEKIKRMKKITGKSSHDIIREAMILFTQSVVKACPPKGKAQDLMSKNKRAIRQLTIDENRTLKAFVENPKNRVKNPHAFWEQIQKDWPEGHPWRGRYRLFMNGMKRRTFIFQSKSAAKEYQPVVNRNIMKYSWITALSDAGIAFNFTKPKVTALAQSNAEIYSKGVYKKGITGFSGYLASSAWGMAKLAPYIVASSLKKTNNRLKNALKKAENGVAAA